MNNNSNFLNLNINYLWELMNKYIICKNCKIFLEKNRKYEVSYDINILYVNFISLNLGVSYFCFFI